MVSGTQRRRALPRARRSRFCAGGGDAYARKGMLELARHPAARLPQPATPPLSFTHHGLVGVRRHHLVAPPREAREHAVQDGRAAADDGDCGGREWSVGDALEGRACRPKRSLTAGPRLLSDVAQGRTHGQPHQRGGTIPHRCCAAAGAACGPHRRLSRERSDSRCFNQGGRRAHVHDALRVPSHGRVGVREVELGEEDRLAVRVGEGGGVGCTQAGSAAASGRE